MKHSYTVYGVSPTLVYSEDHQRHVVEFNEPLIGLKGEMEQPAVPLSPEEMDHYVESMIRLGYYR